MIIFTITIVLVGIYLLFIAPESTQPTGETPTQGETQTTSIPFGNIDTQANF